MGQKHFDIELLGNNDIVGLYSIKEKGSTYTEFHKFIFEYSEKYPQDINILKSHLKNIQNRGALERYFRPESTFADRVCAIPIEATKLRLYCIRISDEILIIGNGGYKTTKTYNEDPLLNKHVETLKRIDKIIRRKQSSKEIEIHKTLLKVSLD